MAIAVAAPKEWPIDATRVWSMCSAISPYKALEEAVLLSSKSRVREHSALGPMMIERCVW